MTVDILLPFWGDPALLRRAVDSVLRQELDDWRLVIVDDCYPDPTVRTWCLSLDDERVSYHRNETNLGANRNYQRAVGLAEHEYAVIMGADDVMHPNYLDVVTRVAQRFDRPAVIQPGVMVIDEHDRPVLPLVDRVKSWLRPSVRAATEFAGEELARRLLTGNWTYFPSLCWRRDVLDRIGFREGFDVVQDLAMLLDVSLDGGRMVLDPEIAFSYRRHGASDSGVRTRSGHRFDEERRVFATFASEMQAAGWRRAARAAHVHATSRLHALSLLPGAVADRDLRAGSRLIAHGLGR